MDYYEGKEMIKLNAFGRFAKEWEKMEREEEKETGGNLHELPNRPQRQELSISPGTMVLGRILFGKFK